MYATILIPVDLEHAGQLEKAMVTAGMGRKARA